MEQHSKGALTDRTRVGLASLLAEAGQIAGARALLAKVGTDGKSKEIRSAAILHDRFRLECEIGTRDSAAAAYADLRHLGWSADPLIRDRLRLFFRYPGVGVSGADLLGLATLLGFLALTGLLPVLLIAPIHLRQQPARQHR